MKNIHFIVYTDRGMGQCIQITMSMTICTFTIREQVQVACKYYTAISAYHFESSPKNAHSTNVFQNIYTLHQNISYRDI